MQYQYPHTIENGHGERITFLRLVNDPAGDWLEVENEVSPKAGPPMHIHFNQEESLTVVSGKIATQILGEAPQFYGPGATATFKAGVAHKFWNAGDVPLICKGYIKPADNVEYFLTEIFKSTAANGGRPGVFDGAWLMSRYRSEFNMVEIPWFVKKVIFPIALFFGNLMGKQRKFQGAPPAVR